MINVEEKIRSHLDYIEQCKSEIETEEDQSKIREGRDQIQFFTKRIAFLRLYPNPIQWGNQLTKQLQELEASQVDLDLDDDDSEESRKRIIHPQLSKVTMIRDLITEHFNVHWEDSKY